MNITFILVRSIFDLRAISPQYPEELSLLAQRVKSESKPVTQNSLISFFGHGGVMAISCDERKIVGAACLIRSWKYNDYSFRIEHVSTLSEYQGKGIASTLVKMLQDVAFAKGDGYIDLTCEPFREQANRIYERLGYSVRETNSRRLRFTSTK